MLFLEHPFVAACSLVRTIRAEHRPMLSSFRAADEYMKQIKSSGALVLHGGGPVALSELLH